MVKRQSTVFYLYCKVFPSFYPNEEGLYGGSRLSSGKKDASDRAVIDNSLLSSVCKR